jgi:hypothetical protein
MKEVNYDVLLIFIVPRAVNLISKKYKTNQLKATHLFYQSRVASLLEDEETKFWHFSPLTLFSMFDQEYKTGSFDIPEEC